MLTEESIGKSYLDKSGREYICSKFIKPGCTLPYYLLLDLQNPSEYPYNSQGVRLNHKLKPVMDSSTTLVKEV